MSWRKVAGTILFSPVLIGLFVFMAFFVIWKLPMVCCERFRVVRYLPYVGLPYYGLVLPLLFLALGFAWWEILVGIGLFAFEGDWLLPDPFNFLLNARKRRAVKLAIEHVEAGEEMRPIYGMVRVVGSEFGKTIVSVPIEGGRPPARRFFAVADDQAILDEVDFEYVSRKHGVQAWF